MPWLFFRRKVSIVSTYAVGFFSLVVHAHACIHRKLCRDVCLAWITLVTRPRGKEPIKFWKKMRRKKNHPPKWDGWRWVRAVYRTAQPVRRDYEAISVRYYLFGVRVKQGKLSDVFCSTVNASDLCVLWLSSRTRKASTLVGLRNNVPSLAIVRCAPTRLRWICLYVVLSCRRETDVFPRGSGFKASYIPQLSCCHVCKPVIVTALQLNTYLPQAQYHTALCHTALRLGFFPVHAGYTGALPPLEGIPAWPE